MIQILIIYILLVLFQIQITTNSYKNEFNNEFKIIKYSESYYKVIIDFFYIFCLVPIIPLVLFIKTINYKHITIKYIKIKNY